MLVHFSPFVMQMQFDSWYERLHWQARRVNTALSAGEPSIQTVVAPRVSTRSYGIRCFQIIYQAPSPDCSLIVSTDGMLSDTVLTWR